MGYYIRLLYLHNVAHSQTTVHQPDTLEPLDQQLRTPHHIHTGLQIGKYFQLLLDFRSLDLIALPYTEQLQ